MSVAKGAVLPSRISISTRTIQDAATAKVLDDTIKSFNDAVNSKVDPSTPFVPLITSPSGYIFSIVCDDSGNLSTALVRKPT